MDQSNIKGMTIELLKDTPIEAELKRAFDMYEKAQNVALSLCNIEDQRDLALTKIGTILSLNLFGILLGGKDIKDFTEDDWAGIAKEVTDKAILMEDSDYSVYIFDLYADYIDLSAKVLDSKYTGSKPNKHIEAIKQLSEDLRQRKESFLDGRITEVAYTEDCLWISLDAMIKCLAAYVSCFTGEEIGEFIQAASMLAFEYGRLKLYRKEQALLNEYLQNQNLLDEQLQIKLDAYLNELKEETEYFSSIVNNAFDTDIRKALSGSVELARATGVSEDEILKSTEDIDDFFMN